ncbi:MAG: ANTAR domain-containing response regulator [Cellulosilyticaceae bacterium]
MNKNIVIVDDDPITRMNIRDILEDKGYNVVGEASEGFSAIEVCKNYMPGLVIMDIDMPMLDGIKAGKILTKENLVGGIILLTGFEGQEYLEQAKSIGAFGYLVKPVSEKLLIPTVEMCLSKVDEFTKLNTDLKKVTNKLNERKLIEKAKGIYTREFKMTEDEAYNQIRRLSMDKRTTMAEIAKIIIIAYDEE